LQVIGCLEKNHYPNPEKLEKPYGLLGSPRNHRKEYEMLSLLLIVVSVTVIPIVLVTYNVNHIQVRPGKRWNVNLRNAARRPFAANKDNRGGKPETCPGCDQGLSSSWQA
jgi:hypothetical protein